MEKILEKLQNCQKEAAKKCIDCSVSLDFGSKEPQATINMYYATTTGIGEAFTFNATVGDGFDPRTNTLRINRAIQFISNVTQYLEEE